MASKVLKVLNPFTVARWVYGDYKLLNLLRFRTDMLPRDVQSDAGSLLDKALDRVLTTRALIAIGLLALVVRIVLDPVDGLGHVGEMWDDVFTDGFMVLIVAPIAVVLLAPLLVLAARPEHRRATARAVVAPAVTAVFSMVLLCVFFPVPVPFLTDAVRAVVRLVTFDSVPMPLVDVELDGSTWRWWYLVVGFVLVWLGLFVLAAAYLCHRNGLCRDHSRLPVLAPVVAVIVVWATVILKFAWGFPGFAGLTGWKLVLTAYCTPVAATLAAAYELRKLAKNGVTFRAPVPTPPAERSLP